MNPEGRDGSLIHANQPITGIKGPSALKFGSGTLELVEKKQAVCQRVGVIACQPRPSGNMPAGQATPRFSFGDSARELHRYANYADLSLHQEDDSFHYGDLTANDDGSASSATGSYLPNAWGIHDMHGNVSEFVQDQYLTNFWRNDPLGDVEKRVTSSSEAERGAVWLPTARAVSVCPVISATMGGTRTFVACEWCSRRNEESITVVLFLCAALQATLQRSRTSRGIGNSSRP